MEGMSDLTHYNNKEIQNVGLETSSKLLTVSQAAGFLGFKEKALRHRIERGQVPVVRVGRSVYLRRSDLIEIVNEGCGLSPER